MMSGSGRSKGPVKVVIINTQYVKTDATSFKSVVQKLTGKDPDNQLATASGKADERDHQRHNHQGGVDQVAAAGGFGNPFLMRDVSFKEFDRLLSQMPPKNNIWSD